ncbi:MAG: hypothetical protein IJ811_00545 [Clostridia bacterium]|nr:hypothetical protein [Clostridia bacterium]
MAEKKQKVNKFAAGLTDSSGRDGFYRNKLEVGRWSFGAELLRANLGKLLGLNLIMLVFIAPIAYFVVTYFMQRYTIAHVYPFSANIGVGYAPVTNLLGMEENIVLEINKSFFFKLPLMGMWLAIGLSGAMYVMRNLCWGEDVSLFKDFFLGVKRNIVGVVILTILYTVVVSACMIGISYLDYYGALAGGKTWYQIVFKVLMIIVIVFATVWYLHSLSLSVTFKGNAFTYMRNGLLISGNLLLPLHIFFAAFSLIGVVFFLLGSSFMVLGILVAALIGVSFFMLVWTLYSQWLYEKLLVNSSAKQYKPTEAEVKQKQLREEQKSGAYSDDDYSFEEIDALPAAYSSSVKPIDDGMSVTALPEYYTLSDFDVLQKSKADMLSESEK